MAMMSFFYFNVIFMFLATLATDAIQPKKYPVKKIASTLNRPVNTVEKQIRKVHGILKEQLAVYRLTD